MNPALDQHKIKLSSAGLVYHHFGRQILIEILNELDSTKQQNDEEKLDVFYEQVYRKFIKEIDGIDNGIEAFENETPKYEIHTGISSRIGRFNLDWNVKQTDDKFMARFLQAIDYIRDEFLTIIKQLNSIWWPSRSLVRDAIENRFKTDETGSIIEIESEIVPPYLKHLFMLEKQLKIEGEIKYCIFKDKDLFRVRAIPINDDSFVLRKPLVEKWRGLREAELCDVAQIDDLIFVHASGFIGGTKTRDAAFKMAKASLVNSDESTTNKIENGIKKQKSN